jgi:hypothetical protein
MVDVALSSLLLSLSYISPFFVYIALYIYIIST